MATCIEVSWTDLNGYLCLMKDTGDFTKFIDLLNSGDYTEMNAYTLFGTPPTFDIKFNWDNPWYSLLLPDVSLEDTVQMCLTNTSTTRFVSLHKGEKEMKTETKWAHYENEIMDVWKCRINSRGITNSLECATREVMYKHGHLGCAHFKDCIKCKKAVYEWLREKYEPYKMLENGDNLKVGQYIRVSNCSDYNCSNRVRFLNYDNGLFYVIPFGHRVDLSGNFEIYPYAWLCED